MKINFSKLKIKLLTILLKLRTKIHNIPVIGKLILFSESLILGFIIGIKKKDCVSLDEKNFSENAINVIIKMKNSIFKWKFFSFILIMILFGKFFLSKHGEINISARIANNKKENMEHCGNDYVAKLEIYGEIMNIDKLLSSLDYINKSKCVKGLILKVKSPGGTLTGSEALFYALNKISKTKPIVAVTSEVAASGGYMVAITGEKIYATPGTILGSIGVIMQGFEYTELVKKLGVEFFTFKTSMIKGGPNPAEKMTPEMQSSMLNSLRNAHQLFIKMLLSKRKIKNEDMKKVINGDVFLEKNL